MDSTSSSSSPKTVTPDIKSFLCRKAAAKREREQEGNGDDQVRRISGVIDFNSLKVTDAAAYNDTGYSDTNQSITVTVYLE